MAAHDGRRVRSSGRARRVWYDDEADEDPMSESEAVQLAIMYSAEPEADRLREEVKTVAQTQYPLLMSYCVTVTAMKKENSIAIDALAGMGLI